MDIRDWAGERAGFLRERYPRWQIWFVPKTGRGYWWCARPEGTNDPPVEADSPDELSAELEALEERLSAAEADSTGPS